MVTILHLGHNDRVNLPSTPRFLLRLLSGAASLSLALSLVAVYSPPPAHVAATEAGASTLAVNEAVPQEIGKAANLSLFRPGNIISNAVFFNSSTMNEAQISAFLAQRGPRCQAGFTCLKDFVQTTSTRPADSYCAGYAGASSEPAARIIYKVAQSCRINPQVLLVMLEKEQSLVTHSNPSTYRFRAAMGQGCPDTAGCDTRYYGFMNQVYGAARQMQIYTENRYFTYYAPGKTWNVRFNPNAACGSSPVFIENQATANLYYYTPYQPNASALRAGYGLGDGCGAYGNRNFFHFFNDWFGSTQGPGLALVRTQSDPAVFLLSSTSRWHVAKGEDYAELSGALGAAQIVSSAFVAGHSLKGTTSAVLRDASSGAIALVQGGQSHRLASCEAVAIFGSSCSAPTNVDSALFARIGRGEEVGAFFRVRGSDSWGRFDGGTTVTPLFNASAARAVNGSVSVSPYAPYLPTGTYETLAKNRTVYAPAQLIKSSTDPKVYLTLDFDRLAWVTDWSVVAEYNRTSNDLVVVSPDQLAGYRPDGVVTPTLTCASSSYFPARGWLYRLTDASRVGLPSMNASASTCDQFSKDPAVVSGDLAVQGDGSSDVAVIEGGKRRSVLSWDLLMRRNAGAPPIVKVATTTLGSVAEGAPIADGLVIKSGISPDLLFVSGTTSHWIQSGGVASDLGIALRHRTLSPAQISLITPGSPMGSWVTCSSQTYIGASGALWPVTAAAAAGFSSVTLANDACAALSRRAGSPLDRVMVRTASSPDVYVAESGTLRLATSWSVLLQANNGVPPQILVISKEALAGFAVGSPLG